MKAKKVFLLLSILLLLCMIAACTTKMVTVSFYADGELCYEVRVEKGKYVEEIPEVPPKEGYKGTWSNTDLRDIEKDLRVDAVYTLNSFTVTFRADGATVATRTVTMGKSISDIPDVPKKEGYTGKWSVSQEDFATLTSDTVVDAVYKKLAVSVTFYKNSYTYSIARVTVGDTVAPHTYYELTDDYVLTDDPVFVEGKSYYTRTRDFYAVMQAEDGVLIGEVPEPPAQQGYSVKWMKINPTPTGDILTTPDFTNVTSDFSVVAYPYLTLTLVDTFVGKNSFVTYDIGDTVSSVRPLASSLADYEFYAWYYDEAMKNPVSFPCLFTENVTLYAKWIGTRATEGVVITGGKVVGYNGTSSEVYIPMKYSEGEETAYVTGISSSAFKNSSVVSVSIPATVTEIGDSAFSGCSSLVTVLFPDGNYVSSYGTGAFRGCRSLRSIGFSDKTSRLGGYAFYGCSSLQTVTGLDGSLLETVERYSFCDCSALTALALPATVGTIEEKAFSGMRSASIVFADPSQIERIGNYAFENCKKFSGFLSSGLKEIGAAAFQGCSALTSATVFGTYKTPALFGTATPSTEEESSFYPVTIDGSTYYVPRTLYNVLVISGRDGVVYTDVLYDCFTVKNVSFYGGAKKISSYAFRLEHYTPSAMPFTVNLPDTLIEVDDYAFYSRNDLTAIELPTSLEKIGEKAFYNVTSLRSVTMDGRGNLEFVGRDAFGSTPWYNTYTGVIGLGRVVVGISEEYCRKATYYEISADKFRSYSVIAPYAFAGNTVLQKITLSDSIAQIGDNAFAGCTALKTFAFKRYVSTSSRQLGTTVLDGCSALYDLTICEDIDLGSLFSSGVPASLRTLRVDYSQREDVLLADKENGFSASSLKDTPVTSLYVGEGFTAIGEEAFKNAVSLTYLSVAENVTSIMSEAFAGCVSLTDVVGLDGLQTIAENSCDGCVLLESFAFTSGLTEIGDYAFRNCAFTSFTAPDTLVTIGESAFDGCSLLKTAVLDNNLTAVGDHAFRGCDLSSLELPASVVFVTGDEFVGEEMLDGNAAFKSLTLSGGVTARRLFGTSIPSTFARITVKDCALIADQFNGLSTVMTATLQNVTEIGDRAFYGCSALQHIVVPASVSSIGESAFEGCSALNSCQIDTSGTVLAEVKKNAFKNCSSLRYVVFPETLSSGDWTGLFYGCAALTTTNVPSAVTEIGDHAYYGCEKLVSLRMHDGVEKIGDGAFENCYLTELDNVSFDSLLYIGESAFENCRKLSNIRAENAEFIGQNAYKNCVSLKELTAGDEPVSYYADATVLAGVSVINIATNVGDVDVDEYLTGCSALESVVVYSVSSAFPARAFAEKVNEVTGDSAITFLSATLYQSLSPLVANVYCKPSQMPFVFQYNDSDRTATVTGLSSGDNIDPYVYLPDKTEKDGVVYSVTAIGGSAFLGMRFTYVVIPSSIEEIGNAAFSKTSVKTVVFESGSRCRVIGENAFKESAVTAISVPSSVEIIGGSAFDGCASLAQVTFFAGSKLRSIGDNAFNLTSSLTSVTFTGPIEYLGSSAFSGSSVRSVDFGALASFDTVSNYAFASSRIASVVLPDTVETIGEGAFSGYAGETFVCPESLTSIGRKAFYKANSLKTIAFSDGLVSIGSEAFYGNTELTKILLPSSLTTLAASAFSGCEKVTEISVGENLESIGQSAFSGLLYLTKITFNARRLADFAENNGVFRNCGVSGEGIDVIIGETVTALPDYFFCASSVGSELPRVSEVSFDGTPSVESIGQNAFKGCSYLISVVIPATVLSIGTGAFVGCETVSILSESAKEGRNWASGYKDNDKAVVFGSNNIVSGDYAYASYDGGVIVTGYTGGNVVSVPATLDGKTVLGTGVTFEGSDAVYINLPASVVMPGSFYGCSSLIGMSMKDGPVAIAKNAFYGCSSMLYFSMPRTVVTVGENAFGGCSLLTTVYLSNAELVQKLTNEKLSETCGGLLSLAQSVYIASDLGATLPADLTVTSGTTRTYNKVVSDQNGYAVWSTLYWRSSSAASASYVYLLNDWTPADSYDHIAPRYNLYVEGIGAMKEYNNPSLIPWKEYSSLIDSITIGRNITSLGRFSFNEMKNLSHVYFLAENCEGSSTPKYVFNTDENTSGGGFELVIGSNVTSVPSYLFYQNRFLTSVVWDSNKVTSIGKSAFEGCLGLTEVIIPNCIVSIGERAFYDCAKVTTLTIGQGVRSFGSAAFGNFGADADGFYLRQIYYNALSATNELQDVFTSSYKLGVSSLGTELIVHKNVTAIPDCLFYGFDRLVQITFTGESSVRSVGRYAFADCTNMSAVYLPLSVTSIGQFAFAGCSALSTIGFADNNRISFIGEKAFYDTAYYKLDSGSVSNWIGNVLYLNDRKFLLEARETVSEDYAILEGTDIVAEKAFASVSALRYVTVPSSVDVICSGAFNGCENLKTVFIVSATVISGLSAQDAQGELCRYATVVYCRSDLMKNGKTRPGDYLSSDYNLAETDTVKSSYQYYSYTKLYWQCAKEGVGSTVYAYLLNDFVNPGYYRMEISGVGQMTDYSLRSAPWYDFDGTDYSALVTAVTFGKNVSSVGSYSFRAFSHLSSVKYNNSNVLTSIGESAFSVCSALTEIEICKAVTNIGAYAFSACGAVNKISFNAIECVDLAANNGVFSGVGADSDVLSMEIDNEVTRVPAYLCCPSGSASSAPRITEIKFLNGVGNHCASIGEYAFAYCEEVRSLVCDGNRLLTIGEGAYYSCKKITSLSIPSKVEFIDKDAFGLCTGLTQITLRAASCVVSGDGIFHRVGADTDGVTVAFSDTVRVVPERFLYNATDVMNGPKVVAVNFPDDDQSRCESIGSLAFGRCRQITSLTLPKTLKTIAQGAFYGCTSLTAFVTPFVGGTAKALSASVETLFGYVFYESTADSDNNDHTGMTRTEQSHNGGDRSYFYIPDSIQEVTVTHYTNIYYGAFQNCANIINVRIELSSVGSIVNDEETIAVNNGYLVDANAFRNCSSLTSVSFSDVLTEIRENAFYDCINLIQITIPVNVTKIGAHAFAGTEKLRNVYFNAAYCSDFNESSDVFAGAGAMQSGVILTVGNAVRRLPAYFCQTTDGSQLTELKMVNVATATLSNIGRHAFYGCEKLSTVSLPGSITQIGQDAFCDTAFYDSTSNWRGSALYYESSAYKYLLAYKKSGDSDYVVLSDTLVIADAAFLESTVLTDITLPESIVAIGTNAFLNCKNLETVTFRINERTRSSNLVSIGAAAFKGCVLLEEITITANVTFVGDEAFIGCEKLTVVRIDSSDICSTISAESAAGDLCKRASFIYVRDDIADENVGTYIRSRYTFKENQNGYNKWDKK